MSINTKKTESDIFIENLFVSIFKFIWYIISGFFRGVKKLGNKNILITFLIISILSLSIYHYRDFILSLPYPDMHKMIAFVFVLALPVIFLVIAGNWGKGRASDYDKIFESIAFKGRNGKYPFFCNVKIEGKKQTYLFKSNIPLCEWLKQKDLLETAFDRNILSLKQGKSKNLIIMTTVPSDCVIPTFISWKDEYRSNKESVLCIGVGALQKISFDLNKSPHALFAGETGSGKSVLLRSCLWQLIMVGARVIMIDFKGGVEFGKQYERYGEVITKRERALEALDCLVAENAVRLDLFRELDVKNLTEYNQKTGGNLCRIGLFCDEIAEMLDKKGASKADRVILDKLDGRLSTLARLARATGINLILGTQRPDANVITGQLKTNITTRVSGRFADKYAYEIALGTATLFELPDIQGRFIFKQGAELIEFQSYLFNDNMVRNIDIEPSDALTDNIKVFFPSVNKPGVSEQKVVSIPESSNSKYNEWSAGLDELTEGNLNTDY